MSIRELSGIVVATLRNLQVSVIHLYSRSRELTGVASGSFRLGFPAFPVGYENPRTGAPAARHPFLGHPWCVRDSDRGIAWGVLTAPSIADLLCLVRAQEVEEEIKSPRYLIGATGEGATRLCQDPEEPLQLRQLILLNRDDNIRAWFLANNGHDPRDLIVLESCPEDREDPDETPKPPNGRHQFFDREVWDDSAGAEDAMRELQEEEWIDEDEWLQAEPEGETRAPSGAGVIIVDDGDVSIETEPVHRSSQDS